MCRVAPESYSSVGGGLCLSVAGIMTVQASSLSSSNNRSAQLSRTHPSGAHQSRCISSLSVCAPATWSGCSSSGSLSNVTGCALMSCAEAFSSTTIQKPWPLASSATTVLSSSASLVATMLAEPTGFVSGLLAVPDDDELAAWPFAPSSFFGERHSGGQCPGLPQLWDLPLRHWLFLPASEPVAARSSSVCISFVLPRFDWSRMR